MIIKHAFSTQRYNNELAVMQKRAKTKFFKHNLIWGIYGTYFKTISNGIHIRNCVLNQILNYYSYLKKQ